MRCCVVVGRIVEVVESRGSDVESVGLTIVSNWVIFLKMEVLDRLFVLFLKNAVGSISSES